MTFCNSIVRVCTVSDSECTKNCKGGKCRTATMNDPGYIQRAGSSTPVLKAGLSHFEAWMKDAYTTQLFKNLEDDYIPKIAFLQNPTSNLTSTQLIKVLESAAIQGKEYQAQIDKEFSLSPTLSKNEQEAVLADLTGLGCLIQHHEISATKADASDKHEHFLAHQDRIEELRDLGQQIIAKEPELWNQAILLSTTNHYTGI